MEDKEYVVSRAQQRRSMALQQKMLWMAGTCMIYERHEDRQRSVFYSLR